ncbi:MAG: hypothetical protein JRJ21_11875 [Deltaproteobacteria bacterium]|nr:hypothetical protein [Deltaproteobacteria bacterium]
MADKDSRMLMDAILNYFFIYVIHKGIAWEKMLTVDTLEAFQNYSGYKGACRALKALSDYLFSQGKIDQPLQVSRPEPPLPDTYEQYLIYHQQSLQVSASHLRQVRRILSLLHGYLKRHSIELPALKIEHLDAFMATFKVSDNTRRIYSYHLKGFLKYLYHERKVIKRDLAPLLVGPPMFAQTKLPKFLRPKQVKKLFDSLNK